MSVAWGYAPYDLDCQVQVVLPPKDDILAPGELSEGDPGLRWFDFSNGQDVEGFNSSTCAADIV